MATRWGTPLYFYMYIQGSGTTWNCSSPTSKLNPYCLRPITSVWKVLDLILLQRCRVIICDLIPEAKSEHPSTKGAVALCSPVGPRGQFPNFREKKLRTRQPVWGALIIWLGSVRGGAICVFNGDDLPGLVWQVKSKHGPHLSRLTSDGRSCSVDHFAPRLVGRRPSRLTLGGDGSPMLVIQPGSKFANKGFLRHEWLLLLVES